MILDEPRLGHIINGGLYLADKGETNYKKYREECSAVYGGLHGVKFVRVKAGTVLDALHLYNWPVPHESQMEILK